MSSKMRNTELAKLAQTFRVSTSATDVAVYDFLLALNTPRSLTVWLLYSQKEHEQLVSLEVNPNHYIDGESFRNDYLATQFLLKADFLKLPVSKKDAAMQKFHQYEELCGQTNNRFRNLSLDPQYNGPNVWLLNAVKRKIDMILGDFSADEFVDKANWGPGVTTLLKGEDVSAVTKFQCETGITRDLYSFVEPWFESAYPLWASHLQTLEKSNISGCFTFQGGNVIVTVPKNSKTDRVIAIEPGINLFFQKSIGSMIRRRLRRQGVDLNSQTRNQELARRSSHDDSLATVDFSSASDSISKSVVEELIPHRWLTILKATRSTIGMDAGKVLVWNKFSSMGNGYTFELESLIFYAAAVAVCEMLHQSTTDVSVFGDDVIIPSSCYKLFSSFCAFLGFRVNQQKSFSEGCFRESCGSHYYDSLDCKPIFLKGKLHNVQALYKLANNIRNLAHRYGSYRSCDVRWLPCWRHLCSRIPRHLRLVISRGIGDVGLIGNFDEATPSLAERGFEGFLVRAVTEIGVTRDSEGTGMLLARLWCGSEREYGNTYTLRGLTKIRISRILVPLWYNLGPWE